MADGPHPEAPTHPVQILNHVDRLGQIAHDTEPDAIARRSGLQHLERRNSQLLGQTPAHTAGSAVQVRMTGVEGNAVTNGPFDTPLHGIGRIEPFQGMEDDRMVGDDQITPFVAGLVEHLLGDVHGQQCPVNLIVAAADDQSRIVIRLLPSKRRKTFDSIGYFLDFHS